MKNMLLGFILTLTFFACSKPKNTATSLNGDDWQFSQTDVTKKHDWQPATVPGVVQTDLLRLGKIPDPFTLNNEDSIQWVSEKNWVYKKEFSVSSEILKKQNHLLKFEGLDTYAEIRLNNALLLTTNNAFRTYEVDVSKILKENNTLNITFQSPNNHEKIAANILTYTLPESPRIFTRKPQFQYGWDWGPKIKAMGIWRDVSLISYSEIRIQDVFIQTNKISEEKALLTAHVEFETFDYDKSTLEIINNTTGEKTERLIEVYGNDTYTFPVEIKNPKRWWTHNLGDPFLYDFSINLKKGNVIIETVHKKVGIRTIELVTEKDSVGEKFFFKLNGKPVYMKGANYIPQNIFIADVKPQQRKKLLDDVVTANMNMLRVWGGGIYEDSLFYDLCDEKGILIWQDFMFACAMYPGDDSFIENVRQEAIDNIKRLRQHPSIALYCGNNENSEGWQRWGWQDDKTDAQKEEIWTNYQALFNDMLPKVVDSLSPSISYWESSPKYGRGDKRYQFEGDAHDWWVWHDGYPFEHFEEEVPRFMSEFGFQSFPSFDAIKYFTQQDSIDLNHPSFATHQKHARGFKLIREYMTRDFNIPNNAEDYIYISQLLQARGVSKGIHAHRRAKPYNMGTLYWQLNDCWPVVSWSSIDGLGNWKALHYEAKKAFENVLISTATVNKQLQIAIVNDTFSPVSETLKIELMDFYGNILSTQSKQLTIPSNGNEIAYTFNESAFLRHSKSETVLKITFGKTSHLHYFERPKNLLLPKEAIQMKTEVLNGKMTLELTSESLQKNVFLYADDSVHFSDNYFDLLPGELKIITADIPKKTTTKITYKTLNSIPNIRLQKSNLSHIQNTSHQ